MYLSHGHHNKKQRFQNQLKTILSIYLLAYYCPKKAKKERKIPTTPQAYLYRSGFTCMLWINNNNVYQWFISYQVVVIKFKDSFMWDGSSSSCILYHWKLMMKLTGSWEIQKKGVQLVGQKLLIFFLLFSSQITLVFFVLFLICSSYFSPARENAWQWDRLI